ncbi:hypothetical protein DY000_02046333 [Brassica cretica]|uniref:Uncharacterized protein n=1 Tax=Brassica cretica TaxID=69181 RepID=A0ABQ7F2V0_BRACR|nr:hypothetical protein DY000_02046333 [Brassica cretica]
MLQAGVQTTQMDRLRFKDSDWTGQTDGNGAARRLQWRGSWPVSIDMDPVLAGRMSLSRSDRGWTGSKDSTKNNGSVL